MGGVGSIGGTLAGAPTIATPADGPNPAGVSGPWRFAVKGLAIVGAAGPDGFRLSNARG